MNLASNHKGRLILAASAAVLVLAVVIPRIASAHCDTMDGPVVAAARTALEQRDITPVLMWIRPEAEPEIRGVFTTVLALRGKDAQVRELADQYFFETLVRVHRAGEGAPYTGLKPAGTPVDPAVAAAEQSLTSAAVDPLMKLVTDAAAAGIRSRHARAMELRQHAGDSVDAGRAYVAAYVDYMHYVERLYADARASAGHEPEAHAPDAGAAHECHHD